MNPVLPNLPRMLSALAWSILLLMLASSNLPARATITARPPTISAISNVSVTQGKTAGPLAFTVSDPDTPATKLVVSAASDNPALLPTASIGLSLTDTIGNSRAITLKPSAGLAGRALVTLTVSDGLSKATTSFTLDVLPANTAPTIGVIPSQSIPRGGSSGPIAFSIGDAETPATALVVTAATDASNLFPKGSLVIGGSGNARTLTLTPDPVSQGDTTVVVTVTDGALSTSMQVPVSVVALDFGDAPESYGTLMAKDGARHAILKGFGLGRNIDDEPDGLPSADARGDDGPSTAVDDEDGVILPSILFPGQSATFIVEATAAGRLDAWVDFYGNGDFADPVDRILTAAPVVAGSNFVRVDVPANSRQGQTFGRFRFSRDGVKGPSGPAPDGEVEDHLVQIAQTAVSYEFGDAPPPYPTLLKDNGARHRVVMDVRLGLRIDSENDGQPSLGATGDDLNPAATTTAVSDDEDGVFFRSPLEAGRSGVVEVVASTAGRLWAWVDFNADGRWSETGDRIFNGIALAQGTNILSFNVPKDAKPGATYSRFRFSRGTIEGFTGEAPDGEVEDHPVRIGSGEAVYDYGDAPEEGTAFPTSIARNGAYHLVDPGFHLGPKSDAENDGQPNATASGDDLVPAGAGDDEDGVRFLTPLVAGGVARIEVEASMAGSLDAWIDFNLDRSWSDSGERIFNARALVPGLNVLSFNVPASLARGGASMARFRFSKQGGLGVGGFGDTGEVEDYAVNIDRPSPCELGCSGQDFWLAFPGNYAPDPANPVRLQLTLIGASGTQVTIRIGDLEYNQVVLIPAAGTITVPLPRNADLGNSNDRIGKKGVHVTSTAPITVHALSQVKYTSDGYTALSTEVLGTEYVVLAYGNVHSGIPELNGTQFAVVGTEDDTRVTITPSVVTGDHDSGFPYTITLKAGESYQLRNTNDAPNDLTGTSIISDRPVAVFAGHQLANVQSKNAFFADHLVEQLLPVQRWGTEFFARPLATRTDSVLRILASRDNTRVFLNGTWVGTLDRGRHMDRILSAAVKVQTDKPVSAAQYARGSDADGVVNSDPFMVLAQQRNLFNRDLRFSTAPAGFLTHHINLVVPTSAVASVQLDAAPVGAAFEAIGASGYSHASVEITPGLHRITCAQPVGVMVYGWNEYESYAWPACPFFGDTTPPDVQHPDAEITVTASTGSLAVVGIPECKAVVPDLRSKTTVTDNCRLNETAQFPVQQSPAPGSMLGVGTHEITLSATDSQGNVGTFVVKFTVLDPNPDGPLRLFCPKDMVVACTATNGAIVRFEAQALKGCTPVPVICTPASGSFFPVGTNIVHCVVDDPGQAIDCTFTIIVRCGGSQISINPKAAGDRGALTLDWTVGAVLESSQDIQGPWTAVKGAAPPFTVIPDSSGRFYRIRE